MGCVHGEGEHLHPHRLTLYLYTIASLIPFIATHPNTLIPANPYTITPSHPHTLTVSFTLTLQLSESELNTESSSLSSMMEPRSAPEPEGVRGLSGEGVNKSIS